MPISFYGGSNPRSQEKRSREAVDNSKLTHDYKTVLYGFMVGEVL